MNMKVRKQNPFPPCIQVALVLGGLVISSLAENQEPASGSKPAENEAAQPARQPVQLPGVIINAQRRCVDVEASICLGEGALELIACTKDSKEHESVVVVEARPIHIHTALLLLGARNGNPAMHRALNEEQTLWADVPPRGDLIEVSLEFKDAEGNLTERPISDFITRNDEDPAAEPNAQDNEAERFPSTFIFAGSQLHGQGTAPRKYLADLSGNVISIASFGDEVLCLPDIHSQENGALMWRIDSTHLPKLGTKVTLRLSVKRENQAPR
jgi:hypothetical protein